MIWPAEISGSDLSHLVEQWHTRFPDFRASGLYFDVLSYGRWELKRIQLSSCKLGRFTIYKNLLSEYLALKTAPPPILYIKETQLVLDGNHRVEVAIAMGQEEILAYVGDRSSYVYVPWPEE